ncbi:hypothetical protein [Naasia aerilata]|uniref:Uncharacterized protein n=1 Tax=Naasia aerilata TaxID=1162966 RepID=A0ABN6XJ97_9MICO|nr:hypothetical protein [Naasia aerilata]BDZ44977.1 hypothetical protein GCM10025866_08860 [Naasia aerilata]
MTGAAFASPSFVAPAVWQKRSSTIPAGVTRDLRVILPDSDCGATGAGPVVTLQFALPDGRSGTAEVPAGDPIGSLARIAAEDCAGQAVSGVTALQGAALSVEGSGADSVAHLTVVSSPSGAQTAVELVRVDSTVLLESAAGGAWPLGLRIAGTDASTSFDLAIVPNRCDPHAVAEDKVGTRLPIVAIDAEGIERHFPLELADGIKDRLLQYVAATCGFGG